MAKMGAASQVSVQVLGADEVKAGLRGADKAMRRELRAEFKAIGSIVAAEAQSVAQTKITSRSGGLVRNIRPQATLMKVVVRDSRKRKSARYPRGYNYPKRFEYEKGGARAFMRPALEHKKAEVIRKMQVVVAKMALAFKLGGK